MRATPSDSSSPNDPALRELLDGVWVTRHGDAVGLEGGLALVREWVAAAERSGGRLVVVAEGESLAAVRELGIASGSGSTSTPVKASSAVRARLRSRDLVIVLSAGRPAPEMVRTVVDARAKGCRVVTMTGLTTRHDLRGRGSLDFFVPSRDPAEVSAAHARLGELIHDARRQRLAA